MPAAHLHPEPPSSPSTPSEYAPRRSQNTAAPTCGRARARELAEHDVDVHERVAVAVEEDDRADDVARREARGRVRGDARGLGRAPDEDDALDVVVVHLELGVAHDLEPVHDGLDGRGGVEVRVRGELLELVDVRRVPVEEPAERGGDGGAEDGWVEEGLPGGDGGHDRLSAEDEEDERRSARGGSAGGTAERWREVRTRLS